MAGNTGHSGFVRSDLTDSGNLMFSRAFARLGKPFDLNQLLDTVHRATHPVMERHLRETA